MTSWHGPRLVFASCGHPNDLLLDAYVFIPIRGPMDVSSKRHSLSQFRQVVNERIVADARFELAEYGNVLRPEIAIRSPWTLSIWTFLPAQTTNL